uniref:Rho GTPase activating protein 27 n=1 Tax=Sinocyclocheilus grahami TaxID=75366 RepID=A0A672RM22_SINGR
MSLSQQVLVNYEYKYTARDGREVSIKPNEHYILVAKTNETWWHVRRDGTDKPFFIPATYVTELLPETNQTSLDPSVEFSGSESLKSNSETAPDSLPTIIEPAEVTLRVPASIKRDTEKDGHRISTYIIPKEFFELKGLDPDPIKTEDDSALTAVYVNLPRLRRSTTDTSSTVASPLQEFPDTSDTLLLDSAGWEIHTDDQSGQEYYYHPSTGRSTWEYPLSYSMESSVGTEEARSPPSFPQSPISSPLFPSPQRWSSDWEKVLDENTGRHYFFNIWIKSLDDRGRTYYYLRDGSKSQWNLPEVRYSGKIWDCPPEGLAGYQEDVCTHTHFVTVKTVMFVCKSITLYKSSHRKNWSNSWTVLHGGILTFHKDPKTPAGTNQIVPEFTVELKGATINRATKDKSSKKNVLELKSRNGVEYLIQYDTSHVLSNMKLQDAENEYKNVLPSSCSLASRHPSSSSTPEADQKKVHTKLMKFLLKRPTLQSIKDKGYIRENVFGCHLHNLCIQEKTRVPSFVEKCIRAVEKRGLEIDGLYRVSGNLAVIQKLRFKADHEDLDLEEGTWDIHVITGALKLFFRELQEPLFPYSLFNDFINGIKIPDYYSKIAHMRNLVRSLPPPNRNTMEALFCHLRKVIQHGDENRMSVQNVAIVFGPTLLKPEVEMANIATYMVFQNQIVEFLLNEFESIFHM